MPTPSHMHRNQKRLHDANHGPTDMTNIDPESPTFLGGSFTFQGGAGCWLTDVLGLLDDDFDGKPFTVSHVAWRRGATVGAVSCGGVPGMDDILGRLERGERPPGRDEGLPSLIRHVGFAETVGKDPSWVSSHVARLVPGEEATRMPRFLADVSAALAAIRPFMGTLDPEAVSACHGKGGPEDDTEYAGFDRTLGPERALARAAEAMPRMRDTLAEMHEADPGAIADAVTGRGRPLREVVHAHMTSTHGKRFASVAMRVLDLVEGLDGPARERVDASVRCHTDVPVQVARELAELPASWAPRTAAEFEDFAACHPAVSAAVHAARKGGAGDLLNARGNWETFRRRLTKACGQGEPIDAERLRQAIRDVDDMVDSFARQVLTPSITMTTGDPSTERGASNTRIGRIRVPWGMARRKLARILLQEGRSLAAMLEASRRWHTGRWRLAEALPGRDGIPSGWPAGLPHDGRDGVDIVPLTEAGQLDDEGAPGRDLNGMAGLQHCVGGHAGACLSGASRIVSLRTSRDGLPVRLSTAEFRPGPQGPELVQHRGHGNGIPPAEASAALDGYVADLVSGRLAWDRDEWKPVEGGDPVTLAAGYDWAAEGNLKVALEAWAPFLPRRLRNLEPAELTRMALADVDPECRSQGNPRTRKPTPPSGLDPTP